MSKPSVDLSIIIVTWNTAQVTRRCLLSLQKYLKKIPRKEIIVIDNGSTDNTRSALAALSFIKYIYRPNNFGFSSSCNLGFSHSIGRSVLFLNSDMQLIDDSLVDMYTFFIRQPHIAAIGPMFLNPDRTPQPSVFPPQTLTNAFKEYWLNLPAFSKYLPPSSKPQPVYCISGGAFLIKRSDFESAGRWDEKYFFYYEDLDLCRRLYNLKRQIYFYPSCQIIHHHGLSGQKLASPQTQWKRLIPGSIIFHGHFIHYLLFAIIRTSQIFKKL